MKRHPKATVYPRHRSRKPAVLKDSKVTEENSAVFWLAHKDSNLGPLIKSQLLR